MAGTVPTPTPSARLRAVPPPARPPRSVALSRLAALLGGVETEEALVTAVRTGLSDVFPNARQSVVALAREGVVEPSPVFDDLPLAALRTPGLVAADACHASRIVAPVVVGDTFHGVIVVEGEPLSLQDLDVLCGISGQVGLVVQRVRPDRTSHEWLRVERDLALAGKIQRRFLPPIPAEVGGLRVAADYRPAFDVGGDFYGVVPIGHDVVNVVIGDVCGHGIAAALMMSRVSYDFHRLAKGQSSPRELLAELNRAITEHCPDDAFVTAMCLRFDLRTGRVLVANAGHLPPLVRRAGGEVSIAEVPAGLPLAMMAAESYDEGSLSLAEGDMVMLVTDGVVDALTHDPTSSGIHALARVFAAAPSDPNEVNRAVLAAVDSSRPVIHDDVAVLTLEMLERQPPSILRPIAA